MSARTVKTVRCFIPQIWPNLKPETVEVEIKLIEWDGEWFVVNSFNQSWLGARYKEETTDKDLFNTFTLKDFPTEAEALAFAKRVIAYHKKHLNADETCRLLKKAPMEYTTR